MIFLCVETDRKTDRQTDRKTDRKIYRKIDRKTDMKEKKSLKKHLDISIPTCWTYREQGIRTTDKKRWQS